MSTDAIEMTVRDAEKRDASRGIARVPPATMSQLGILSGETAIIGGETETVVKVWPGGTGIDDGEIRIDGDTRTNAGVRIGERVTVRPQSVTDAEAIALEAPAALGNVDIDDETLRRAAKRDLEGRPVTAGEQTRLQHLGGNVFVVEDTVPGGAVRVTDTTEVRIHHPDDEETATASDAGGADSRAVTAATSAGRSPTRTSADWTTSWTWCGRRSNSPYPSRRCLPGSGSNHPRGCCCTARPAPGKR
jgi:transitional endoplasmic reticulum ATPase